MEVNFYYNATPINKDAFRRCSSDAAQWLDAIEQNKNTIEKMKGDLVVAYLSYERRVHAYSFSDDTIMEKLYAAKAKAS